MNPLDIESPSKNDILSGAGRGGRVLTLRARSKPSLVGLLSEQPGGEPLYSSDSGSGAAAAAASSSSSNRAAPLPVSSMLPAESSRMRTPLPVSSSSNGRGQGLRGAGGVDLQYAADWLVVFIAIIVLAVLEEATPREGYIPKAVLNDTNYPMMGNSVPIWSVPLYTLLFPAILFALHSVLLRRPMLEAHHLVLGLSTAVLLTAVVTNMIKCPVGRLRPDFNARCWPDGVMQWQKEDQWGGYAKCTGNPDVVAEGRKSFPSGHSSWSASGLCYCTWFLLDRLQAFGAGNAAGHPWRLLLACLPAMGAFGVGVSRYTDYWHHPTDIAAGLLLGGFISWLCYRQQRCRLVEVDVVTYGGPVGAPGVVRFSDEMDGIPLLQQQGLPV